MNSELYAALVEAGASEGRAHEAAISAARGDAGIAEIGASLLTLKWMAGFALAFVAAIAWRMFG